MLSCVETNTNIPHKEDTENNCHINIESYNNNYNTSESTIPPIEQIHCSMSNDKVPSVPDRRFMVSQPRIIACGQLATIKNDTRRGVPSVYTVVENCPSTGRECPVKPIGCWFGQVYNMIRFSRLISCRMRLSMIVTAAPVSSRAGYCCCCLPRGFCPRESILGPFFAVATRLIDEESHYWSMPFLLPFCQMLQHTHCWRGVIVSSVVGI